MESADVIARLQTFRYAVYACFGRRADALFELCDTALTAGLVVWLPAAVLGGVLGAEYGSRRLATPLLRQCLAAVLVVAGAKLILT